LPWTTNLKLTETNLNGRSNLTGNQAVFREQSHCGISLGRRIEHRDLFDPIGFLAVVDFSQVNNLPLKSLALLGAPILADAPVAMILAVLKSRVTLEEQRWFAHRLPLYQPPTAREGGRSGTIEF